MPEETIIHDKNKLLSPAEAVNFLNTYRDAHVTVDILRQMKRKGRVKAMQFGGKNSRTTLYRIGDLLEADIVRREAGRPSKAISEQSEKDVKISL